MKRFRHVYLALLFCLSACSQTPASSSQPSEPSFPPSSLESSSEPTSESASDTCDESSFEPSTEPSSEPVASSETSSVPSSETSSAEPSSSEPSSQSSSESSKESSAFPTGQAIDTDANPLNPSEDHYRTMYEIFPYSFADSDGDGVGDLWGALDKLDYLHDLHYEGVWLTPVSPSPSYHKYDILDYYDVDSQFGGIEAFDAFVERAHELGMTVLFDLVLNHSALNNEWFSYCADAVAKGDEFDPYYGYYNIKEGSPSGDWYSVPGHPGYIYEGVFYSGMPDLRLQSVLDDPEGFLAGEIHDICDFWLNDHNVDGFRLDAVTSYFTGNQKANTAFLTWLNDTCKELKPDCYIVGEGSWDADSIENLGYQSSGIDSFFNFVHTSVSSSYSIGRIISSQSANRLGYGMSESWRIAGEGMPANFVANHDTTRMVGLVSGRKNIDKVKLGHTLLTMLPGATFNYYGDEIGMSIPTGSSDNDPDRRLHMDWGDDYTPNDPPGHMAYTESNKAYPYPNVAEQLLDEGSILNHVRKANALRQMFPEIARGQTETLDTYTAEGGKAVVTAISKTTADSSIVLVINPSVSEKVIYDFGELGDLTPVAELAVEGASTYEGTELYLAPGSVVVLK